MFKLQAFDLLEWITGIKCSIELQVRFWKI